MITQINDLAYVFDVVVVVFCRHVCVFVTVDVSGCRSRCEAEKNMVQVSGVEVYYKYCKNKAWTDMLRANVTFND